MSVVIAYVSIPFDNADPIKMLNQDWMCYNVTLLSTNLAYRRFIVAVLKSCMYSVNADQIRVTPHTSRMNLLIVIFYSLYLDVLAKPIPLFPALALYCNGLLCTAGVPLQAILGIAGFMLVLLSAGALRCSFYRYQTVLPISHPFRLRKYNDNPNEILNQAPFNLTWAFSRGPMLIHKRNVHSVLAIIGGNTLARRATKFAEGTLVKCKIAYGEGAFFQQKKRVEKVILIGRHYCRPLEQTQYLVLDEADRMLDMGFAEEVMEIMEKGGIAGKEDFVENGEFVQNRVQVFKQKTLIFVASKTMTDTLGVFISEAGTPTTTTHGVREQNQREAALADFRSGRRPFSSQQQWPRGAWTFRESTFRPSTRMVEGMMAASQEETNGADGDSHREGTESTADDASVQAASGLRRRPPRTRLLHQGMDTRKRKCSICPRADEITRKFPANSRESAQVQWIERLGMSEEESKERLDQYRTRIEQGADIRWCSDHFDSSIGLPKDASLGTPPPFLSPIRCPSPLRLDSSLTLSGDDLNNDIYNNLPAMFRRQSSIRTEGGDTTVQGSEYIPTAASQCDSDESDCEETNEEGDNAMRKYRIVANDQLHKLFRRCQECGGVIDTSQLSIRTEGSACVVDYTCLECGPGTWKSQGRIGKGMSTVYEGNQEIAISSFVTGLPLPRLIDCAAVLGLSLPSERTMRRTIRDIGCPAIDNVFTKWQTQVRNVSKAAAGPAGIAVSIDGQYDSPGFNAQNCKVTVIDAKEKLAIAGVNLHKNEPGIDGKSIRMEATGALRAIKELLDDNFVIKTRVTDSNASVDKKLREDPQTESIEAEIDWWHTQKSVKKEWWKRMKTSPVLGQLYQPFFNHLFYCHAKFPDKEDRPKALEYVRSFLKHVQGKHSWKKSEIFSIVTKCDHEQLKRRKQGEPPRPTLKILRESEQVRRDLEEGRLMRRIGMPTDLVFDELCTWEANRNGQMVNEDDISDEEDGEDEVFEEGEDDDEEDSYQY
ncbi:hypothetical protein PRIPAC_77379 [Pristionchus pacificus]|uniref:Helicase n=1 Tax=Pristionchus pacificus TaxID=54126 RepID=A0A2A6CPR9_PRIPA|nr:hypothetical protein PRIPAC_77379 [Pristionchus pacificus]|eukprot:PDM80043.1 helicase [Pristionchus pacificus]